MNKLTIREGENTTLDFKDFVMPLALEFLALSISTNILVRRMRVSPGSTSVSGVFGSYWVRYLMALVQWCCGASCFLNYKILESLSSRVAAICRSDDKDFTYWYREQASRHCSRSGTQIAQ